MDLRIERTKKCIKDAFINLRKVKQIEKITVKELSMCACINKATFYSHYNDIYDLSEHLEDETILSVIQNLPHIDSLVTNPSIAIKELTEALILNKELTDTLFSGSRKGLFAIKLEANIKSLIFKQYPQFKNDFRWNMVLTFVIQGGLHSYTSYAPNNEEEAQEMLCELNTCIKKYFLGL